MARGSQSVAGKTVLITGAARGIGAETARRLAARGARLSLVGLEPEGLERVASECSEAAWFEADVTNRDALESAVEATLERFGGIDVVMANAGIAGVGTLRAMDPAGWERIIEVNLLGVYRTLNVCLPHVIERRGYVLPVASMAAAIHTPGMSAYAATKAGVEALADALRGEVKHLGVDVGVAYYSWIDTDMVRGADDHPAAQFMRGKLRGPAAKTYTVEQAGEITAAGIEARARRIVVPKGFRAILIGRMAMARMTEFQANRYAKDFIPLLESDTSAEGAAAVGAGGAADNQARTTA
jgi:NAD(P)-dependent dehydrogenase (short-subunit alcohol dehydrogenase family)